MGTFKTAIENLLGYNKTTFFANKLLNANRLKKLTEHSEELLASLDGLMQLHCNGNVTKAHGMLEKHLNQAAHGQNHTN